MIIASPLNLPSIEPDSWEIFWKIWKREAKNLKKVVPDGHRQFRYPYVTFAVDRRMKQHLANGGSYDDEVGTQIIEISKKTNQLKDKNKSNSNTWLGLDIYKNLDDFQSWEAPFYNIKDDLPVMYNAIKSLPFKQIQRVRLVQSLRSILPHTDDNLDKWQLRYFFHYTDSNPQWYFIKPKNPSEKKFLVMPNNTKWFCYNDKFCWHGTTYNKSHPKILLQFYLLDNIKDLVETNTLLYKDYVVDL